MNVSDIQRLLASTGYYKGGVDNDLGERTMNAVSVIERTQSKQYPETAKKWGDSRRAIAAAQATLNATGFNAGEVDGLIGNNTREAFRAWDYKKVHGKKETVRRIPAKDYSPPVDDRIPRQSECRDYYGQPGKTSGTVRHQIVTIELPFSLRIDWNLSQTTNRISVHKKAAPSLQKALIEVHETYGIERMRELGIDRFAGSYNPRPMRGGSAWSMHAYGCAIDFYAQPNGLRVRCPQALFCRPEYKPFLDIMEKHGWLPAVRLWGKDAMHFQRARM